MSERCILMPFFYGDEKLDRQLLDIEDRSVNLLRGMDIQAPCTDEHVETFDQFLETYGKAAPGLGIAFRGQKCVKELNSKYARIMDEIPALAPDSRPSYELRIYDWDYYRFALKFIRSKTASKDFVNPMARDMFMLISQHYGGPSPFLDWTLSMWNALYFAFESANPNSESPVALYMVDIGKMHHASLSEYNRAPHKQSPAAKGIIDTLATVDAELDCSWIFKQLSDFGDIRVYAQDAIVARQRIMPGDPVPLEDYVSPSEKIRERYQAIRPAPTGTLRIITLPASEKFKVLDRIAAEHNVRHETLFPDLSKLMKEIWEANVRDHWKRYEGAKTSRTTETGGDLWSGGQG